jgi:hypothetical protein
MNFLEALASLQAGECEGIRRSLYGDGVLLHLVEGQLYRRNRDNQRDDLHFMPYTFLATDWELVNPKPRTEQREVKRWAIYWKKDNALVCTVETKERAEVNCSSAEYIVELTGTYEVEIPRKVKRREEIPRNCLTPGYRAMSPDTRFFAEWEE